VSATPFHAWADWQEDTFHLVAEPGDLRALCDHETVHARLVEAATIPEVASSASEHGGKLCPACVRVLSARPALRAVGTLPDPAPAPPEPPRSVSEPSAARKPRQQRQTDHQASPDGQRWRETLLAVAAMACAVACFALAGAALVGAGVFLVLAVTSNVLALSPAHRREPKPPVELAEATGGTPRPTPSLEPGDAVLAVQKLVAHYFEIDANELRADTRRAEIAWPRQVAMWLCRETLGMTLMATGEAFGGRNHATVIHAGKVVRDRVGRNAEDRHAVESLEAIIAARLDREWETTE